MRFLSNLLCLFLFLCMTTLNADIRLENAFPALTFDRPVDFQNDGSENILYVVEQRGVIYSINVTDTTKTVFLDIRDRVNDSGNEEGLLGLAFHPKFASNGFFYVDYTAANPRRTVVARYNISATNPGIGDKASELVILEQPQPFSNHNAGQIAFGPDGYLYITFGDGGSGGDPQNHGQDRTTLLGSIARIDVDMTQADLNYAIPEDNPFVGNSAGFREEIYAYGLRNPWRMSFDSVTGWLWTGDVGQNQLEEIDIIKKGGNYGWKIMEGTSCYNSSTCDTTGLVLPVWEYGRSQGGSVTGGFVYRGSEVPDLYGAYVYADYISGRIWALTYDGTSEPVNELLLDTNLYISAFGVDATNELYLCAFDGKIYKFLSTSTDISQKKDRSPYAISLSQNYPNPFNASTTIPITLTETENVSLNIFDVQGRLVRTVFNGTLPQGEHRIVFDAIGSRGRPLASGIYFYQLVSENRIEEKAMLLLQ